MNLAEDKLKTQVITFVGSENGLFVYHTARVMQAARHDISLLVIDNSFSHDLFNMLPGTNSVKTLERATVVADREFTESVFKKFECVLVYLGKCYEKDYIDYATKIYYMCDYTPESEAALAKTELPDDGRVNVIFYNKMSKKIKEDTFLSLLKPGTVKDEKGVSTVYFDDIDFLAYNEWLWGTSQTLNKMSPDFKSAVAKIAASYFNEPLKNVLRLTKSL